MKFKQTIIPAVFLCTAFMLPSCSMFGPKKSTTPVRLPHDRENIAKKTEVKTYTPEELKRGVVKGDWAIEKVYGKETVGETAPFIKFVPEEKRIYGNNGCNTINADYTYVPSDSTLSFGHIASTMMLCHKEGLTDYEINTALGATKYYSWSMSGDDYYLYFYDELWQPLMTLMHQNFQFLNGSWRVTKVNDKPAENPDMQLVIDVDEGKLHGNTGCNVLNGKMETDMEQANSISFSAIATTRMACPDYEGETAFVVALEEVSTARPVSGNEVVLYDSRHKPVLTLVRL